MHQTTTFLRLYVTFNMEPIFYSGKNDELDLLKTYMRHYCITVFKQMEPIFNEQENRSYTIYT